jgi:mannose-6-phosphate isomerase-like protein (cupin superfamily)
MTEPANLAEKLATFSDRFSPRTVATYNNNDIMVAKLEGPFHWHRHDDTDDFFLVLKGTLDIELRDRTITLNPGEVFVVPRGVEHRPVAREEVHILLIEPTGTPNTGDKTTAAPRTSSTHLWDRRWYSRRSKPRGLASRGRPNCHHGQSRYCPRPGSRGS